MAILDVGPIRGMRNVEGKLFVVAAQTVYQISNTGVAIPAGPIPGVGRVSMAHNQFGLSNQLIIVNGSAGYIVDTSLLTVTKITDEGYPGAFIADYIDQYLVQVEPQGRFWFHSDLANGTDYNTLDRYEAEADPDRIVSLLVSHREVLVFGRDTIEPFVNTGGQTGTFERASNTVIEFGCAARFTPRKLDNSVFWLDDKRLVRRLGGYTPIRVSTDAIDSAFQECSEAEVANCYAFTWESRGHKVYYITIPGRFTFGYDVLTRSWHRRSTWNLAHWDVVDAVYWNGRWIVGSGRYGRLYELDWDYKLDSCDPLVRRRVTGKLWDDENDLTLNNVELKFNTGGVASTCVAFPEQPVGPTITGAAPDGVAGELWGPYAYAATGGTPPYTFSTGVGHQPIPGLSSLTSAGELPAGTPTTAGTYNQVPRVTDANGLWDELVDPVTIAAELVDWLMLVNDTSGLLYSHGADDWSGPLQPRPGTEIWQVCGWGDGELLMSNRGDKVAWSDNKGASWTVSTLSQTISGNKGYVARLNGYWWVPSGTLTEIQRGDGVTFTQPASGTAARGESIAATNAEPYDKLFLVAPGQAKASKSEDNGASWAFTGGDMKSGADTATRIGIASNGTRLVIAGAFTGGGVGYIAYSDDEGATWIAVSTPFVGGGARAPTYITYRGGKFIIGNEAGQVAYSTTGASFTLAGATGNTVACNGIDYDGVRHIAIFADSPTLGYMVESLDDMATWQTITPASLATQQYDITAMTP